MRKEHETQKDINSLQLSLCFNQSCHIHCHCPKYLSLPSPSFAILPEISSSNKSTFLIIESNFIFP